MKLFTKIFATKSDESGRLLTPTEVAERIGVSQKTLAVWRCVGRYNLPFIKVGRKVMYSASALNDWLQMRTRLNSGPA